MTLEGAFCRRSGSVVCRVKIGTIFSMSLLFEIVSTLFASLWIFEVLIDVRSVALVNDLQSHVVSVVVCHFVHLLR